MRTTLLALVLITIARVAVAQTLFGPSTATFTHPDAEYNGTATYRLNIYQCTSLDPTTQAGIGCATSPVSTVDVPRASVTTTTAPTRKIDLKTAPASTVLTALPAGVPFTIKAAAVGDPVKGFVGTSAESGASNGFFQAGKTPAVPGTLVVQ